MILCLEGSSADAEERRRVFRRSLERVKENRENPIESREIQSIHQIQRLGNNDAVGNNNYNNNAVGNIDAQ